MSTYKWLSPIALAAAILPVVHAEPHCPGNVPSLRFRLLQRHRSRVPGDIVRSAKNNHHLGLQSDHVLVEAQHHLRRRLPADTAIDVRLARKEFVEVPDVATACGTVRGWPKLPPYRCQEASGNQLCRPSFDSR